MTQPLSTDTSLFVFAKTLLEQTAHTVHSSITLGIHNGGIDGRGVDATMAQQLRDGIDVGTCRERHRGIAVACRVEGDVLCDTSI